MYGAISGVKAQPINKWTEFKLILKQLENPNAKNIYETCIVDTVDIAYDLCERYVCQREGVDKIADIPWGAGYKMVRQEFFDSLRKIAMLDFGLVMISHSLERTTEKDGETIIKTISTLNDRAKDIVFGMSDIIGYSRIEPDEETGKHKMVLYLRETLYFEAGSRFKYMSDVIDFTYDNLVNAIADAIQQEEKETGIETVEKRESLYKETVYDFDAVNTSIKEAIKSLTGELQQPAEVITEIVERHLGKGRKVKDCAKEQVDIMVLILDDLKGLEQSLIGSEEPMPVEAAPKNNKNKK